MPRRIAEKKLHKCVEEWEDEFANVKLNLHEGDIWIAALAIDAELTVATIESKFVRHHEISHPGLAVHVL